MERPSSSSWHAFVSRPSEACELRTAPPRPRGGHTVTPAPHIPDMIRIAITPAAFDAVAATLVLGTVAVEPERDEDGSVRVARAQQPHIVFAMRGPGESYSDAILRAEAEGRAACLSIVPSGAPLQAACAQPPCSPFFRCSSISASSASSWVTRSRTEANSALPSI
jgi:hypothetical protein